MADVDSKVKELKNTNITVLVDEALPDILVVTYEHGVKIFKGVLLDSTKRNLPPGVPNMNPVFNIPPKNRDDDTLYSVNQRFAYMDPSTAKKRHVQHPSKYKNNKMTVRLRPRQVLCSKCKGICNENSENVSKKRRNSESSSMSTSSNTKRSINAPVTRSVNILNNKGSVKSKEPTLVSKLTRLEIPDDPLDNKAKPESHSKKPLGSTQNENALDAEKKPCVNHSSDGCSVDDVDGTSAKRRKLFRKRRADSCLEDQSEDTDNQENPHRNNNQTSHSNSNISIDQNLSSNSMHTNTRTIKISYGPQGEGTVLKIPAQIDNIDDDSEENINIEQQNKAKETDHKAAKRALKRAKKEARRKVLLGGSPLYLGGPDSIPRYTIAGNSPRYTVGSASPRQGLGNNSPRYVCTSFELNVPRRRKHKVKHKKKHKDDRDRKHKEGEVSSTQDDSKEQCITQKLSINLKRLNNTYTSCSLSDKMEDMSSSDEHGDMAPNFPPPNPPLMLRINAQTVTSALGADGVRLLVGDVVWGKILGFPWWPGKILTMTSCGGQGPQAHVAWYGSSTSSLMQCDQLSHYLDNFKIRYNKKKKGPYKEAIKQATTEARENAENRVRQPLGNSPSHNIIQIVPPALASPREIDVLS